MNGLVTWMESVFEWLKVGVSFILLAWVFIALPLLIFRKTRMWGAKVLVHSSYFTGFTCWWFCFIVSYRVLGLVWLVVGLLCAGIGAVPLAFFGLIIKSLWTSGLGPAIVDVLFAVAAAFVPRSLGLFIAYRTAKRQDEEEETRSQIALQGE